MLSASLDQVLDQGCHEGWVEACGLLGLMKIANVEVPDKENGARFLRLACDAVTPRAALISRLPTRRGGGVLPNPATDLESLKRACDLGLPQGCRWLAEETALYRSK